MGRKKIDIRKNWGGIPIYTSRVFQENRTPETPVPDSGEHQQEGGQVSAQPEGSVNRVPITYSQMNQHHIRIVVGS